ncbi:MAG TPA: isochorismatase family cysteine hydrolase [Oligoflexus sp.]|uniref:isochorismatase family cysteine hydrolase n=1 Tax=Oligoflexus sp. TaxID=1971216 RepID=UPI002D7EBB0A|nr:isochorismatase family cysteine hydrolase [Oligoflexus sp.]HET9241587.1 isochorismatase family cysteine hydrolase [Oligoflexus sp.]
MPRRSADLHGNAPHESKQALVIIDAINDLEWEGAEPLRRTAVKVAKAIAHLKARATAARVPCIYVNDNFGMWRSDFHAQVDHCAESPYGGPVVALLRPNPEDYYILKAKHSGFYASPLHLLLDHIKAEELILTGFTTDSCVLFTATDAYLRDYRVTIPEDCVASCHARDHKRSLELLESSIKARIVASRAIRFKRPHA